MNNLETQKEASLSNFLRPPFCILAGAGISFDSIAPSGAIINAIINSLPIEETDKRVLRDSISPGWRRGIGYFDFLRFEQLFEALSLTIDAELMSFRKLFENIYPAESHRLLAQLLNNGSIIITTNFDDLIERACEEAEIEYSCIVNEDQYLAYLTAPENFPNPIFKLHGHISSGPPAGKGSQLGITLTSVLTDRNIVPPKWKVVDRLLSSRDLLVVGYSGSDDFDVMPAILFASNPWRIAWVQHQRDTAIKTLSPAQQKEWYTPPWLDPKLHWTFTRLFGGTENIGKNRRQPEDIQFFGCETVSLLRRLESHSQKALDNRSRPVSAKIPHSAAERPGSQQNSRIESFETEIQKRCQLSAGRSYALCGLLFSNIGLYDSALNFLNNALANLTDTDSNLLRALVHRLISEIWLDREEPLKCQTHVGQAIQIYNQLPDIPIFHLLGQAKLIARVIQSINPLDPPTYQNVPYLRRLRDLAVTDFEKRYIDCEVGISCCHFHLARESYTSALEAILTPMKKFDREVDIEHHADFLFLSNKVTWLHANAYRNLGLQQQPEEDQLGKDWQLIVSKHYYELLQTKRKWAESLLLHAEMYRREGWAHWAVDEARLALAVLSKIGSRAGQISALEILLDSDDSPESSETAGELKNRIKTLRNDLRDEADRIDEVHYFCPFCGDVTLFRIRACTQCGCIGLNVPENNWDKRMSPEEKFQLSYQITNQALRENPKRKESYENWLTDYQCAIKNGTRDSGDSERLTDFIDEMRMEDKALSRPDQTTLRGYLRTVVLGMQSKERSGDAKAAWDNLMRCSREHLASFLKQEAQNADPNDSDALLFFYGFGYLMPAETLAALESVKKSHSPVYWRILANQLGKKQITTDQLHFNPFSALTNGMPLRIEAAEIEPIEQHLWKNLIGEEKKRSLVILEAMVNHPSLKGLRMLLKVVNSRHLDEALRLLASPCIAAIVEQLVQYQDIIEKLKSDLAQIAAIVANDDEEGNIRAELAQVFRTMPTPEGEKAIGKLIRHTESTGFGSAYLENYIELRNHVRKRLSEFQPPKRATTDQMVSLIFQIAQTDEGNPVKVASKVLEGEIVNLEQTELLVHYNQDVIKNCVHALRSLGRLSPPLARRISIILFGAVAGSAEAHIAAFTLEALDYLKPEYRQDEFTTLIELIDKFLTRRGAEVQEPAKDQMLHALYGLGNLAQKNELFAEARWLYINSLQHCANERSYLGGGCELSLGTLDVIEQKLDDAIPHLKRALEIFEVLQDAEGIATALMEFGNINTNQGRHSEAIAYYERAITAYENCNDDEVCGGLIICLHNLAKAQLMSRIPKHKVMETIDKALRLVSDRAMEKQLKRMKSDLLSI